MTTKSLLKLIAEGEGLNIEFKQRFSSLDKIAKEVIAFANTKGGYLIFGVNDNGSICGVESEKGTVELMKDVFENRVYPNVEYEIEYFNIKNNEIVLFNILESKNKPHRINDYSDSIDLNSAQVFIRVNDKSVPASKEMVKLLQNQTANLKLEHYEIGKNEKIVFELLENQDSITVKELQEKANISGRRASRTLIKLVRANILFIHSKDNGESFFTSKGI